MARLSKFYGGLDNRELLSVIQKGTARYRVYALKAARDELLSRGGADAERAALLFSAIPNVERLEPLITRQQNTETDIRVKTGMSAEGSTPDLSTAASGPKIRDVFLTTEASLNNPISARLEIVSAEAAINMRGIRDFLVGTVSSGEARSLSNLNELQSAKRTTLEALRLKARELQADAVVGVTLRYEQLGAGINMLLVVAMGTAVRLADSSTTPDTVEAGTAEQGPLTIPIYEFESRMDNDDDARDS
jgi:uncharacterized protein YbjQ (UPF0145 family)